MIKSLNYKLLFLTFLLLIAIPFSTSAIVKFGIDPNYKSEHYTSGHNFQILSDPGEEINDKITVRNVGDQEVTVKLYAVDGFTRKDNGIGSKDVDELQKLFGIWTTLEKKFITVQPGTSESVNFTTKFPDDITPGDYIGMFAAEESSKAEAEGLIDEEELNIGVKAISRVIFPAFIKISGEIINKFEWNSFTKETTENNDIKFIYIISNKGTTIQTGKIKIRIKSLLTAQNYHLSDSRTTLTPGSKNIEVIQHWKTAPIFGKFKATATIEYQRSNFSSEKKFPVETIEKELTFWIIPKNIFTILIILILVILTIFFLNILRKKSILKSLIKYKVKEGDTINSLSKEYNLSWKLIAKINNIEAPYEIKPEQILFIPTKKLKNKK